MPQTVRIELNVHDGTRRPIPNGTGLWVTLIALRMGKAETVYQEKLKTPLKPFEVEYQDAGDMFTAHVRPDGYADVGFGPFPVRPGQPARVGLMVLPKTRRFSFDRAGWDALRANKPELFDILSFSETPGVDAQQRYEKLMKENPLGLAAVLNIMTAVKDMTWKVDARRPIEFFKGLDWAEGIQQDRFWAWADAEFLDKVREAAAMKDFEKSPKGPHPGATVTYKQCQFLSANVQFSFQENVLLEVGGKKYMKIELDIDYHSDKFAHMIEVIGNIKGDTNPMKVYVMRWCEGEWCGVPFDPPLTVVA